MIMWIQRNELFYFSGLFLFLLYFIHVRIAVFDGVWQVDTMFAVRVCRRCHGGGTGAETSTSYFQLLPGETCLLLQFALIHRCTHTTQRISSVHITLVQCHMPQFREMNYSSHTKQLLLKIAHSNMTSPLKSCSQPSFLLLQGQK